MSTMGTAINLDEIKRVEVTEVYNHPDAKVDIVLVHGLNGDPRRTWTAKDNDTFWPTQLLPVSLKSAQARILVYGYNADVYTFGSNKSASSDMIHHHAQSLIANLSLERKSEETESNPIIFVAHSLGGILVKRALELSNDLTSKNADDNRSIFVMTYGIIFLGTPHNGADPAKWGVILQGMVSALVPKKIMHSESQLVKTLQSNNETLQNINLHFLDIYQKFKICMVHEAAPTDIKGSKAFVVDKDSAAPMLPDVLYFGIEATHSGMCKFESKNSPGYLNVSTTLKSWVQECGPIIQARWEHEKRQRDQARKVQAAELLGAFGTLTPQASTSANTPDPASSMNSSIMIVKSTASIEPEDSQVEESQLFIKPSGFRPNSLFVGRGDEMVELHKMLFDKKRRAEGTSAVLIQSMPGGGKSHLAREYVYRYRAEYPGGVFWLRAKSTIELAAGFWDIAKKAVITDLCDQPDEVTAVEKASERYIRSVQKWLNKRQKWLMVLDGIHFNEIDELRRFIPDSIDTALIYTSTERAVTGNYLIMNPQVIKLPLLSAREAQTLLLLELDRKEPFSTEDLNHAMQLVRAMEFLPVVIHAVAQRLKSTQEPLARFARNFANEPRLRGLGTYKDVVKQLNMLGASESLNLIYILCFFSQHIPVEMISLGLKALDSPYHVPVKASEPITGRSLNNTFKMLNKFALIERNEEDPVNSSRSSRSSRNMIADTVDVIRLHSVVQGFFVDTLSAAGSLPLWLDHSVRLFCCSYDRAHERITQKVNAGLVEDYRVYEIHGFRIREHVTKHLSHKHLKDDEVTVLNAASETLKGRLESIKSEIERRTPESSHVIAVGKSDVFQTSIFDRTSSSSDTGPETPGAYDRNPSRVSTWGLEPGRGQQESPTNLIHDADLSRRQREVYLKHFPPVMPEDVGYESDRESASGTAMAFSHSQQTVKPGHETPIITDGWAIVNHRGFKPRESSSTQHRSVRTMKDQRYRDSAGSYRDVSSADPRLTKENARGILDTGRETGTRQDYSSGSPHLPLLGASEAEVALARMTRQSTTPATSVGLTKDQRSSPKHLTDRPRIMTGLSSYAAAVAGSTKDSILSWTSKDSSTSRPSTADTTAATVNSSSDRTVLTERPSAAIEALHRFPIQLRSSPATSPTMKAATPITKPLPMPPYPVSPFEAPISGTQSTYPFPELPSDNASNLTTYPTTLYPRLEGAPPFESLTNRPTSKSRPDAVPIPLQYPRLDNQQSSVAHSPPFLSLSFPDVRTMHSVSSPLSNNDTIYVPGHPEYSTHSLNTSAFLPSKTSGYTSQPMSRDVSGNSAQNNPLHYTQDGNLEPRRRRPSLAETEPPPQLPTFSPRIPPTSYQVYERLRKLDEERRSGPESPVMTREEWEAEAQLSTSLHVGRPGESLGPGGVKRSPRLEYARSALIERLEDWNNLSAGASPRLGPVDELSLNNQIPARRTFNPAAPTFSPSYSFAPSSSHGQPGTSTPSFIPPVPPSATLQHDSSTLTYNPANTALQPQEFATNPQLPAVSSRPRSSTSPASNFAIPTSESQEMARTTSGGVKIGKQIIEFGDFPEPVDVDVVRARAWKQLLEREKEKKEREADRRRALGLGS